MSSSEAAEGGLGELVGRAANQTHGSSAAQARLQALDDSFGLATQDNFDGMNSSDYVDRQRRGLRQRLCNTLGEGASFDSSVLSDVSPS